MSDAVRIIMHMDMDAFFASVEVADNPALKGKPVIIGKSDRGVVSAASYEAREYGVHSAMPVARARQLCPHGIFLSGSRGRYSEVSKHIMSIVDRFSPVIEQTSIDEAYVDLSGTQNLFGPPEETAEQLKQAIFEETGLTCSTGLAPNKYLAKICSDINKPNGMFVLHPNDVAMFLTTLPVEKIPGVGRKALLQLNRLNIRYAADLQSYSMDFLTSHFGNKYGNFLYNRGRGIDNSEVVTDSERKSCGAENTFAQDTSDREVLKHWLMTQSERVAREMRSKSLKGRTITLKLKYADFTSLTKGSTVQKATNSTLDIFSIAEQLLDSIQLKNNVRLIGVSVSNFGSSAPVQLSLLHQEKEDNEEKRHALDSAMDTIRNKFGSDSLQRGRVFCLSRTKEKS